MRRPLWVWLGATTLGAPFSPEKAGLETLPEVLRVVGSVLSFLGVQLVVSACFPSALSLHRVRDWGLGGRNRKLGNSLEVPSEESSVRSPGRLRGSHEFVNRPDV